MTQQSYCNPSMTHLRNERHMLRVRRTRLWKRWITQNVFGKSISPVSSHGLCGYQTTLKPSVSTGERCNGVSRQSQISTQYKLFPWGRHGKSLHSGYESERRCVGGRQEAAEGSPGRVLGCVRPLGLIQDGPKWPDPHAQANSVTGRGPRRTCPSVGTSP